jgi:peptide/nickel transport system substrate-binding protein
LKYSLYSSATASNSFLPACPRINRNPFCSNRSGIWNKIQQEVYDQVIYIPLGQYRVADARRKSLSGVLDGRAVPVFWNIDKSE